MASNQRDLLGEDLENIGKVFKASASVTKTVTDMTRVKEDLESLKKQLLTIDFEDPSMRQLLSALDNDISLADDMCSSAIDIGEKHSVCIQMYQEMKDLKEITNEIVEAMYRNFNELLRLCVTFEKMLADFVTSFGETRKQALLVESLAIKEENRLNRSAAETRSAAKKTSIIQLVAKIATFGLITSSSGFQEAVAENNRRYSKANRLQKLQLRFQKTCQELREALKSMEKIEQLALEGPVKLNKDIIGIITHTIQLYEHWERMKNKLDAHENTILERENTIEAQSSALQERENTIEAQSSALQEKDDKIAELEARIARMEKS